MTNYGLQTRLHEIQVPHWERGTKEVFYLKTSEGTHKTKRPCIRVRLEQMEHLGGI